MGGRGIELIVLGLEGGGSNIWPEAWLTAYPGPIAARELILE
jgi:hypothetical protein